MIYVDQPRRWNGRRKLYAHMASDVSLEELHAFAASIGLKKHWFHKDHYDLREDEHAQAIRAGAIQVTSRELVRKIRKEK